MSTRPVPPWWPHVQRSRHVSVGGLHWHVQRWTQASVDAPCALLLHGTGASAHSWRTLAPLLAAQGFDVVAPDLPGHGFTNTPRRTAHDLPSVAQAVSGLLQAMNVVPQLVIGHSAGAAVALRMALNRTVKPALTVAINGAILPLQGPLGRLFLPIARLMAVNPVVAPAFAAWAGTRGATQRLIRGTGSRIDAEGERAYAHLVRDATHAAGALQLMASWDLDALARDLRGAALPLLLVAGDQDRMLPPAHADRVRRWMGAGSLLVNLGGLGHLAHEEDAARVWNAITPAWLRARGTQAS